jgi:hypothetical protein
MNNPQRKKRQLKENNLRRIVPTVHDPSPHDDTMKSIQRAKISTETIGIEIFVCIDVNICIRVYRIHLNTFVYEYIYI